MQANQSINDFGVSYLNLLIHRICQEGVGLLHLLQIHLGGGQPQKTHCDLVPILKQFTIRQVAYYPHHSIELIVSKQSIMLNVDVFYLQQILGHLVQNGVKYSPPGSRIIIRASLHQSEVIISVIDQGDGIPICERPFTFSPFYRGTQHQQKVLGLGLGLYAVKKLADLHGGRVLIKDGLGGGSQVAIYLSQIG